MAFSNLVKKKKQAKIRCDNDGSDSLLNGGVNQESICSMEPEKTPVESPVESPVEAADGLNRNSEISLYRTPPCTLKIGPNGVIYTVLQGLLDQCPEWAEKCKSDSLNKIIELPDIDEDIGHALVHYLYTGTYHTQGLLDHATTLTKYNRSVGLYCVAEKYGFNGLKELSKHEAETHGKDLPLAELLDVAEEAFKKLPDDEVWFTGCLETRLEAAFEGDRSLFLKGIFLDHIGNVKCFDKALVKCMAKIYAGRDVTPEEPFCVVEEAAEVSTCAEVFACVEEYTDAEPPCEPPADDVSPFKFHDIFPTADPTEGSSAYTSKKGKKGKKTAALKCSSRAEHLQDDDLLYGCSSCCAFVERVAAQIEGGGNLMLWT